MSRRNDRRPQAPESGPQELRLRGQHFLHNKRVIAQMIEAADFKTADTVVDIGAGTGAITVALAEHAGRVIAIENDPKLAERLRRRLAEHRHVAVLAQDIERAQLPGSPYLVVANIPFYRTTSILRKLLDAPGGAFREAVLLIEHGAARGFTADPVGSAHILAWRIWFEIKLIRAVPRTCFLPPPRVDGAIVRITRRENPCIPPQHRARFLQFAERLLKEPLRASEDALAGIFTPPQLKRLFRVLGIPRDTEIGRLLERQWSIVFLTFLERAGPVRRARGRS